MSESIGYMLHDLARLMRKRFDEDARDIGITNSQWRVLANVFRRPGINQGTLADIMEVEPITTCRMVDRLELAGLVERRRDPGDRRAWQIFLTDAAMPLMEELKERSAEFLERTLAGISEQENQELMRLLNIIRQNLMANAPDVKQVHHG